MTRIGILSFAHLHADSYAACINQLPEAELDAIWDDNPERGRKASETYGAPFIPDLDDFLARDLECVIITAENINHRALCEKAAAAGKWILSEKPLATTIEDAQAMIEACETAGVGLGTAFPCRYAPPLMAVQEQIANGELGEIYAVSCTNNGQFPGGWFGVEELSGGGATMDHTVHVVDLLRWMLGREFTRVYCENGHLVGRDTALDDVGCLTMQMEGGVMISHVASWNRPKSFPTWGDVTMEFIGEKGVTYVDAFSQKLDVYNDVTMRHQWAGWGGNPDLGLVKDFVDAVAERRSPSITGYDGLKAVEVTVAAYKSAERHQPVALI